MHKGIWLLLIEVKVVAHIAGAGESVDTVLNEGSEMMPGRRCSFCEIERKILFASKSLVTEESISIKRFSLSLSH